MASSMSYEKWLGLFGRLPKNEADSGRFALLALGPVAVEAAPLVLGRHALDHLGGGLLALRMGGDPLAVLGLVALLEQLAGELGLLAQALAHGREVRQGIVDRAEVGQRQLLGPPA